MSDEYRFREKLKTKRQMERKEETRRKIQLGGLIVKAGLDHMHPGEAYILYGMLLDCQHALTRRPELKDKWKEMGKGLLVGKD